MGRIWSSNFGATDPHDCDGRDCDELRSGVDGAGAHDRGYELVFAEDAMTSVSPEVHGFVVSNIFPRMGRIRSTEQVLAAIGSVTR